MTNNSNLLLCVRSKDSGDEVERIKGETHSAEQIQRNIMSDFTFF